MKHQKLKLLKKKKEVKIIVLPGRGERLPACSEREYVKSVHFQRRICGCG